MEPAVYFLRRRAASAAKANKISVVACLGVGKAEDGCWAPGFVSALWAAYLGLLCDTPTQVAEAGRPPLYIEPCLFSPATHS